VPDSVVLAPEAVRLSSGLVQGFGFHQLVVYADDDVATPVVVRLKHIG
jgi:hypothetical protein